MPPSPPPSQQPSDAERSGTLLETDDDIRRALLTNQPAQPAAAKAVPPTASAARTPPPRTTASPYRPTLRPPIVFLTVLDDGKSDGEVVRLRADRFVIGRSEGDFLIPHDQLMSKRHLEITRHCVGQQYRWVLTDLQTTNGLYVRVSRTVLADKTQFLAGKGWYRFELPGSEPSSTVDHLPEAGTGATSPVGVEAAALLHPALVELVGGRAQSRLPLVMTEYWIGSDPACSICRTGDPFVEPRHARLWRDGRGAWQAENNKTANGLWVKMPQITVTDSCLFQIGEQRFRLKVGG